MFNKLKQFKDLRSKAKQMQTALSGESVTEEYGGIKITMNGNMEVTFISIDPSLTGGALDSNVKQAINKVIQKTQKLMAQKMKEMGGMPSFS